MVGFALSCFGLLLFLWLAFGGSIPLKPKGYQVQVTFAEAGQLAVEADVRISGVPVGKVKKIDTDPAEGTSVATVQLEERFAPLPKDTQAMLRQKTLLGETYIEHDARQQGRRARCPRAACCPRARSPRPSSSTRSSAPSTRTRARRSRRGCSSSRVGIKGRARDINDILGNLEPFAEDANELLEGPQHAGRRRSARSCATRARCSTRSPSAAASSRARSRTATASSRRPPRATRSCASSSPSSRRSTARPTTTVRRLEEFARRHRPARRPAAPGRARAEPDARSSSPRSPPTSRRSSSGLDPLITASEKGFPATRAVHRGPAAVPRRVRPVPQAAQPDRQLAQRVPQRDPRRSSRTRRR